MRARLCRQIIISDVKIVVKYAGKVVQLGGRVLALAVIIQNLRIQLAYVEDIELVDIIFQQVERVVGRAVIYGEPRRFVYVVCVYKIVGCDSFEPASAPSA